MSNPASKPDPAASITATLARRAAQAVLSVRVGEVSRVATGRSCEAYIVRSGESGSGQWVVRVPVPGTDRSIRFHAEAALGSLLASRGHPVASWDVVEVEGITCAVGQRLAGTPITYGAAWTSEFSAALGNLLTDLHGLPATGFGPLIDDHDALRGEGSSALDGVRRRWCWARCWPFDGSDLAHHPVTQLMPDAAAAVAPLQQQLLEATRGPIGVVHSDLHHEHLLAGPAGALTGVLDFGDAFVGSVGWDFAQLHWYYGPEVSRAVAHHHPDGRRIDELGRLLATALGIYKLAKSPRDPQVPGRLRRVLLIP